MKPAQTDTGRLVGWVTLGILMAGTLYIAWQIVGPYAEALLAGVALAILVHPLYTWIEKRSRRTSLAAFLSTGLVVVTVLVPMGLIITSVVHQLQQGYQTLGPETASHGVQRAWELLDLLAMRLGTSAEQLQQMARSRMEAGASAILRQTASIASLATSGIIQLIVVVGALYTSLLNGSRLHKQALAYSPLGAERTNALLEAVQHTVVASFYGVVAVAAAQGILMAIGAAFLGLPVPVLWGMACAVFSVLPVVGSALVWVPAAGLLFLEGNTGSGIFMLIWGGVLVASMDNLVRPLIVMTRLPVSGLLVFIAILGGMQAFGLIGLLVGPVTLAVGLALVQILQEELKSNGSNRRVPPNPE